jgi:hypothetical protein
VILALKLLLGGLLKKLLSLLQFAIEHWRIVLPALLIGFLWWQWYTTDNALQAKTKELADYIQENETAAKVREAENKAKEDFYKQAMSDIRKEEAGRYATLEGAFYALDKNKRAGDRTIADMRDQLRRQLEEASATQGLPGLQGRSIGLTGSGENGDAIDLGQALESYVDTLEQACALTTQDYNTLYRRCAASQRAFGSE